MRWAEKPETGDDSQHDRTTNMNYSQEKACNLEKSHKRAKNHFSNTWKPWVLAFVDCGGPRSLHTIEHYPTDSKNKSTQQSSSDPNLKQDEPLHRYECTEGAEKFPPPVTETANLIIFQIWVVYLRWLEMREAQRFSRLPGEKGRGVRRRRATS